MARGRGFLFVVWKLKYVLLILVLLILVAGGLFVAGTWFSGDNRAERSESFVEQVRDLNSLATSQAFVKTVVEQSDNQLFGQDISINLPGTQRTVLLIVPGTVLAGVNLESVEERDIEVDEEAGTIEMTVPRAVILQDPALDMENVQAFSSEGIFRSNVNWEEGFEIAATAQQQMEDEAVEQGILTQAEQNAERALKELFGFAGYEATITFSD